jgi:hypothetical protein
MISAEGDYTTNYGITGGQGREDHRRNAVDSPQPISALEHIARDQQKLISAFAGNAQMLREIADKLFGPEPPASQPGKDANKHPGAIHMLAEQVETLGHIQGALTHVCERLSRLA